jgi:hypothetical protein
MLNRPRSPIYHPDRRALSSRSTRHSTPGNFTFAAQWLAYTLPCRRFALTLADDCARLGANADRYSFIAADSHRLLLAGLPAHNSLKTTENPAFKAGHKADLEMDSFGILFHSSI